MVTGPMPRKPKATRPNAKTAGASICAPNPCKLAQYDNPISAMMVSPIQYALKLPAVKPDRMLSDAPPSRDDVTISRTCREPVDVNTLTSSGITAPAIVPQLMISDSFHQRVVSPPSEGIMARETTNVRTTETIDVSHTSDVSGCSKFMRSALAYLPRANASLTQ